jgi:hypothetical protein
MVLSVFWGRIWELNRIFKHLVQETWWPTCVRYIFKLYKIQTKSKIHETCRDAVTSHVIPCGHMWRCLGFQHRVTTCSKSSQFFITASTCDVMTSRQVSWFSGFVYILYNLKSNRTQVGRYVSCTRCLNFRVCPWIKRQNTLKSLNIIFWIGKFHYFMHL